MFTIAIPANENFGLASTVCPHFGRAPYFTLIEVEDGKAVGVKVVDNQAREGFHHEDLGELFRRHQVKLLLVGGIGGGAVDAMRANGIEVIAGVQGTIADVIRSYFQGKLAANEGAIEWNKGYHSR